MEFIYAFVFIVLVYSFALACGLGAVYALRWIRSRNTERGVFRARPWGPPPPPPPPGPPLSTQRVSLLKYDGLGRLSAVFKITVADVEYRARWRASYGLEMRMVDTWTTVKGEALPREHWPRAAKAVTLEWQRLQRVAAARATKERTAAMFAEGKD